MATQRTFSDLKVQPPPASSSYPAEQTQQSMPQAQPPPYHSLVPNPTPNNATTKKTLGCLNNVSKTVASFFTTHDTTKKHNYYNDELVEPRSSAIQRPSSSSSSSSFSNEACSKLQYSYAGNFTASSSDIHLEKGSRLVAYCRSDSGKMKRSSIQLNAFLRNSFGKFTWYYQGNFMASAANVRLTKGGKYLEADLGNGDGVKDHARIRLDERIANVNGSLVFVPKHISIKKALK